MSNARRLIATLLAAGLIVVGIAASAAPAHASSGPPCEWARWGTESGCDGLDPWSDPHDTQCSIGGYLGSPVDLFDLYAGQTHLATAVLWFARGYRPPAYPNGTCRTAWGQITVYNPNVSYCRVEVRRNSDGQMYEAYGAPSTIQRTAVVYDADVTSYVWAICLYNGTYYTGRTRNY
jgi:hypothetical protein